MFTQAVSNTAVLLAVDLKLIFKVVPICYSNVIHPEFLGRLLSSRSIVG